MAEKQASKMVRYCGNIVNGSYCDAVLQRSATVINGHYEGVCPKCSRFYTNYNSRPQEPKKGIPALSRIKEAEKREAEVKAEIEKLQKSMGNKSETELKILAYKNIAYEARNERQQKNREKAEIKAKVGSEQETQDRKGSKNSTKVKSTKMKSTKMKSTKSKATKKKETAKQKIDKKKEVVTENLEVHEVVKKEDEVQVAVVPKEREQSRKGVSNEVPDEQDVVFFQRFSGADDIEYGEFPDIIEDVECETIVLTQPQQYQEAIDDSVIESVWTDTHKEKYNLTVEQVRKLLLDEITILKAEKFVLEGINFNPDSKAEEVIINELVDESLNSLLICGKTYTQDKIDTLREMKEKRKLEEQRQDAEGMIKSMNVKAGLSYNFLSGVMTEEQEEEFKSYALIPKRNLKKQVPTIEQLYKVVNRVRIMETVSSKKVAEVELETLQEYDAIWKGICSDMCNKEYGEHSYWIAAGTDWFITEYVTDVIKTAFATGLSVVPMATLDDLKEIFDKSHGYLNDMEFLAKSPRAMRDSVERFTMFNEAYKVIYEGAVSIFKPKALEPPHYTWSAYLRSDVVVVLLPETGLATGGVVVLAELLRTRALTGKATILISTISIKRMNELNTCLVPALFGQNGIAVTPDKDKKLGTYLNTNTYVYYTFLEDRQTNRSLVQKKLSKIESKVESKKSKAVKSRKKAKMD